ncbi:MAG TPA: hypothetical protein VGM53_35555 [Streptosporangiaceae bacterium]|jgi:hypothetical protein
MTGQTGRSLLPRPAASYGTEEMAALLTAGARLAGTHAAAAAAHLLIFTELPGGRDFARHVQVDVVTSHLDGAAVLGAWVKDWDALLADDGIYLTGSGRRMLQIAASYAAGHPVDLSENGSGLGTAHARRLIEAVIIGAGMAEFYTVTGTSRLDELNARRSDLAGGR